MVLGVEKDEGDYGIVAAYSNLVAVAREDEIFAYTVDFPFELGPFTLKCPVC